MLKAKLPRVALYTLLTMGYALMFTPPTMAAKGDGNNSADKQSAQAESSKAKTQKKQRESTQRQPHTPSLIFTPEVEPHQNSTSTSTTATSAQDAPTSTSSSSSTAHRRHRSTSANHHHSSTHHHSHKHTHFKKHPDILTSLNNLYEEQQNELPSLDDASGWKALNQKWADLIKRLVDHYLTDPTPKRLDYLRRHRVALEIHLSRLMFTLSDEAGEALERLRTALIQNPEQPLAQALQLPSLRTSLRRSISDLGRSGDGLRSSRGAVGSPNGYAEEPSRSTLQIGQPRAATNIIYAALERLRAKMSRLGLLNKSAEEIGRVVIEESDISELKGILETLLQEPLAEGRGVLDVYDDQLETQLGILSALLIPKASDALTRIQQAHKVQRASSVLNLIELSERPSSFNIIDRFEFVLRSLKWMNKLPSDDRFDQKQAAHAALERLVQKLQKEYLNSSNEQMQQFVKRTKLKLIKILNQLIAIQIPGATEALAALGDLDAGQVTDTEVHQSEIPSADHQPVQEQGGADDMLALLDDLLGQDGKREQQFDNVSSSPKREETPHSDDQSDDDASSVDSVIVYDSGSDDRAEPSTPYATNTRPYTPPVLPLGIDSMRRSSSAEYSASEHDSDYTDAASGGGPTPIATPPSHIEQLDSDDDSSTSSSSSSAHTVAPANNDDDETTISQREIETTPETTDILDNATPSDDLTFAIDEFAATLDTARHWWGDVIHWVGQVDPAPSGPDQENNGHNAQLSESALVRLLVVATIFFDNISGQSRF
ncbi:MAG TPA: hypothetical protein PLV25_02095 [Opitutales bacterium]|nr:hypothetical protein [Opitutales bacterium]